MTRQHQIKNVNFINGHLKMEIDGKTHIFDVDKISKRLSKASLKERKTFQISPSGYGIHWPLIDEDLSIDALLHTSKRSLAHSSTFKS